MLILPAASGSPTRLDRGFTLVEVLAVLAVAALLLAVLIPSFGAAREHVAFQAVRLDWKQWEAGVQEYAREYGCAPVIADSSGRLDPDRFLPTLALVDSEGAPVSLAPAGNPRRIPFLHVRNGAFRPSPTGSVFVNALGGSLMGCLVDSDGDGVISGDEIRFPDLAAGNPSDGFGPPVPTGGGLLAARIPVGGIRSSAAFFAITERGRLVTSWE